MGCTIIQKHALVTLDLCYIIISLFLLLNMDCTLTLIKYESAWEVKKQLQIYTQ